MVYIPVRRSGKYHNKKDSHHQSTTTNTKTKQPTSNVIVHALLSYDHRGHPRRVYYAAVEERGVRSHDEDRSVLPTRLPTTHCYGHTTGEVGHFANEAYQRFQGSTENKSQKY